jgi:copper chaperone CopZ
MYSTFLVVESECSACTNVTLKDLGTLRGVFGAEVDRISGEVVVSHTDEINRNEIEKKLVELGYEIQKNNNEDIPYDDPSIWDCVL